MKVKECDNESERLTDEDDNRLMEHLRRRQFLILSPDQGEHLVFVAPMRTHTLSRVVSWQLHHTSNDSNG